MGCSFILHNLQLSVLMKYGRAIRSQWLLDDNIIFLNHGSFGACPKPVLAVQRQWQDRLETEPVRFMMKELPGYLDETRATLAHFLGAKPDDLVFVQNATDGANAIIRSLLPTFKPGDELLTTTHAYRAIRQTMKYVGDLSGATVTDAIVPFPISDEEEVVEAIKKAITPKTAFAMIDHLTSPTGVIFPIEKIIPLFKERGIPVLIDGAHAPGMIDLDIEKLGADFYIGNCHKWLYTPKGSAFLWVDKKYQANIHPTLISHFLGLGFHTEFNWTGTLDPAAWLSIPAGIDFLSNLNFTEGRAYTKKLMLDFQTSVSDAFGTPKGAPDSMIANLCTIPLPGNPDNTEDSIQTLHDTLFNDYNIEAPGMTTNGKLYLRASAAIYNEASEYTALLEALKDLSEKGMFR